MRTYRSVGFLKKPGITVHPGTIGVEGPHDSYVRGASSSQNTKYGVPGAYMINPHAAFRGWVCAAPFGLCSVGRPGAAHLERVNLRKKIRKNLISSADFINFIFFI